MPDCSIVIFAKAPVPGYAKTRLARAIGDAAAAGLAARMLHHTVENAIAAKLGPVELCCAPDASHPAFQQAAAASDIRLTSQGGGDLGERMHRALARHLEHYSRVLLIGTDAPGLAATQLRDAADALLHYPAVFGPAADGGYVLVGLTRPLPALFHDMAWSTDQVMRHSRERLAQLGVAAAELPLLHDIDEPDDLVHLPKEWEI
jgi:hypothetical protein